MTVRVGEIETGFLRAKTIFLKQVTYLARYVVCEIKDPPSSFVFDTAFSQMTNILEFISNLHDKADQLEERRLSRRILSLEVALSKFMLFVDDDGRGFIQCVKGALRAISDRGQMKKKLLPFYTSRCFKSDEDKVIKLSEEALSISKRVIEVIDIDDSETFTLYQRLKVLRANAIQLSSSVRCIEQQARLREIIRDSSEISKDGLAGL